MKIAIFGRITDNTDPEILLSFFSFLKENNISFQVFHTYSEQMQMRFPEEKSFHELPTFRTADDIAHTRFIFCFGGDGTVLEVVRFAGHKQIPILGVNFGRLGYLTSITQTQLIPATEKLLQEVYKIEERSMLSVVSDPPGIFQEKNQGINDLTIHKSITNEMITVHAYINGEFLNSYRGDGIIVATPTGSTAYSLSCGGPIIFPHASTFVITPVAPHSLTVRPVVIPDDWVISLEIEARSGKAMVSLDTRTKLVDTFTSLAIKRAEYRVQLLRMSDNKHIDNLRRSLMWGSDNRNK